MLQKFAKFLGIEEKEGLALRLFLCLFGIVVGVVLLLFSQLFVEIPVVRIILIVFSCIVFVGFLVAAWVDYAEY